MRQLRNLHLLRQFRWTTKMRTIWMMMKIIILTPPDQSIMIIIWSEHNNLIIIRSEHGSTSTSQATGSDASIRSLQSGDASQVAGENIFVCCRCLFQLVSSGGRSKHWVWRPWSEAWWDVARPRWEREGGLQEESKVGSEWGRGWGSGLGLGDILDISMSNY